MRIQNAFVEMYFFVCALVKELIAQFLLKGQVWKWVWILEVWSENGCGK